MSLPSRHRRARVVRYLVVLFGVLLVIVTLGGLKFLQISRMMAFGAKAAAAGPPPEAVGFFVAETQTWERTLSAVGTVTSTQSTEIRNEVPGVVKRIGFNSGSSVNAGELLVELDPAIERSQLAAARARRKFAETTFHRAQQLFQGGAVSKAELDRVESDLNVARGDVSTLEARLNQKEIKAPFSGRVGIREVSVGQFLNPGTRITVLDAIGGGFVDFWLPQEDAAAVSQGTPVRVTYRASPERTLDGEVVAIGPIVDRATRNLGIRARMKESADATHPVRPGTFVEVALVTPEKTKAVVVPATAIVHAPYGNSVFVLEEKKPGTPGMDRTPDGRPVMIARQQFVRLGPPRGDFVAVLEGLKPGVRVISSGAFKLRNGAPVVIDQTPAPKPELKPTPENR